ncbi:MAG: carboxymuconolactone decarboxylase family protein [Burkholderiales bacterium]|nr:carboxymuconolactone decarboxylase family protein [Burkholderiales bacterium]
MARVALINENARPDLGDLVVRIRGERGGRLLNIFQMLLHSPALAAAWLEQVSAVRWKTELDGRLRELVILRVGALNRSDYVFKAHVPAYTAKEGLSLEQCRAVADWRDSAFFAARERAALAYTDAMTRDVQVPAAVFDALRAHFSERQIVELTVLIGTYNMHTRVLEALEIDPNA